ncbi:unnamed protein product [Linum trigynum]|uniref:Uncharacterized protein n=1 Tax=Linum trigynum TaxID=586398 RepID=A0AAV2CFC4_9ROSI
MEYNPAAWGRWMSVAPEGTLLDPDTFRPINLFRAALLCAKDAIPPLETSLSDLRLNPSPYPSNPMLALPAAPPQVLGTATGVGSSFARSPSSVGSTSPPCVPKAEPITPPTSRGKQLLLEYPPSPPTKYVNALRIRISDDDLLVDWKRLAADMESEGSPTSLLAPTEKKAFRSLAFLADVDATCKDLEVALGPLKVENSSCRLWSTVQPESFC